MKVFELPCLDSRKSFYGKAHVIELDNGTKQLKSYDTVVGEITNGKYKKLWAGSSMTTNRHIKSFKQLYDIV